MNGACKTRQQAGLSQNPGHGCIPYVTGYVACAGPGPVQAVYIGTRPSDKEVHIVCLLSRVAVGGAPGGGGGSRRFTWRKSSGANARREYAKTSLQEAITGPSSTELLRKNPRQGEGEGEGERERREREREGKKERKNKERVKKKERNKERERERESADGLPRCPNYTP